MGSIPTSDFDTIVFDLGNVLIKMPPQAPEATETSSIPTLRRLISTSTWMRYECGELDETQCYEMLGKKFGLSPSAIAKVISEARDTFEYDTAILSWIRKLMEDTHGSLKFIATWRIPIPEHAVLYKRWRDELSSIFDEIFTSSAIGIRQPDLGFYRHVLKATGRDSRKTILIDSDVQNLVTACSLGMHTISYQTLPALSRTMKTILYDPLIRGDIFLNRNAKHLHPETDCGTVLVENLVQLLILDVTGNENLIVLQIPDYIHQTTWNYYIEQPSFTNMNPPNDLDTTSLALQVMPPDNDTITSMLNNMLKYINPDGIPYVKHPRKFQRKSTKQKLITTLPRYTTIARVLASTPSSVSIFLPPSTSISGVTNSPKRATGYGIFFSIAHICTVHITTAAQNGFSSGYIDLSNIPPTIPTSKNNLHHFSNSESRNG
ncbi:hypothetical protein BPAE_0068g00030 [Botrytis paeoniae]|uniref:Uncharacterized protein n=1 Tax=Botrytis paeoniae TaxID=278948 RepID=A0A4Z1FSN7_9HELO|nr:hypothetical protein BPAE_0068g00030 [Botrytis paeoniae]